MRLGDLDALKDKIPYLWSDPVDIGMLLDLIDNAPTVNPCENCDLYFMAKTKEEMRKGGAK